MARPGVKAEQDDLRARMRGLGMTHDEIAVEFARRYRLRPRAAHRLAHGWTQQQAANHVNAHAARVGLDPTGKATMTAPRLCELENWPHPDRRRPTPQVLALLAEVYGTDVHSLLDLDDREHLTPADHLLINSISRTVTQPLPSPSPPAGVEVVQASLAVAAGDLPPARSSQPATEERWQRHRREESSPVAEDGALQRALTGRGGGRGGHRWLVPTLGSIVERMVVVAARESADFGRDVGRGNVNPLTVEQFHADLTWLAERYPNRPVAPSFAEAVELRNRAFSLLEDRQRPSETRDLYVIAGTLCGMLANASFDLGYMDAAATQARTAFLCGELAGHDGLRCWVRGMQSLIAYWCGRLPEAASLAHDGWEFVPERGTARVRAAALEARAAGRQGDEAAMRDALRRAEQARDEVTLHDEPGGMLAFPEPKQLFYTASAYLGLNSRTLPADGWAARAEQAAGTAIGLYAASPAAEQRLGELSLARLDLAAARLERSDLDGAALTVRTVLDTMARAAHRQCPAAATATRHHRGQAGLPGPDPRPAPP
jgi:hypothetical protein